MDTDSTGFRPGWGLDNRPPVKQGWAWMGTILLVALLVMIFGYWAAVTGCAAGDCVLIKIMRTEPKPKTVMEVQSDADDSNISEREEDVSGDDRGRDLRAFMELWGD